MYKVIDFTYPSYQAIHRASQEPYPILVAVQYVSAEFLLPHLEVEEEAKLYYATEQDNMSC